jgi:transposase InsO family protein
MKKSTRREKRRRAHEQQWAEITALGRDGQLSKRQIAERCHCCKQTVYNVLGLARKLPAGEAPVPQQPGPPPGTGTRQSAATIVLLVKYRQDNPCQGYHGCRAQLVRDGFQPPAGDTIGRIWRQHGLLLRAEAKPRRRTRWVPPRPQAAGHLQLDVKYLPGGRYEYTAIDVYSRFCQATVQDRLDAQTAADFLERLLRESPFAVHTIQTDGGGEFKAEFAKLLSELELGVRRNTPHSPWQNGVVERFHRTVAEECYLALEDELDALPTAALDAALQEFLQHYNYTRLHSSLSYRPPAELLDTIGQPVYPRVPKRCPTNP